MACLHPINITPPGYTKAVQVPCGKCMGCIKRKRNDWFIRINEESKVAKCSFFFTLTYDDDHIPVVDLDGEKIQVLSSSDCKTFMKNFRRELDEQFGCKCRFYLIGEYGPTTFRPHYHGIIFLPRTIYPWQFRMLLRAAWKKGFITAGKLNDRRKWYCVAYTISKVVLPPVYKSFQMRTRCSKGLGDSFLTDKVIKYYKDSVNDETIKNNKYIYRRSDGGVVGLALPGRYKSIIYTKGERAKIAYLYAQKRAADIRNRYQEEVNSLNYILENYGQEKCNCDYLNRIVADSQTVTRDSEQEEKWFESITKKPKL